MQVFEDFSGFFPRCARASCPARVEVEALITHEKDIGPSRVPFFRNLIIHSSAQQSRHLPPLPRLADFAPAISALFIAANFSKLRITPANDPPPLASFHRRPQSVFSVSVRRGRACSSQLDNIRRAKLHFAAELHFLDDLVTAVVLVRLGIDAPLVIVIVVLLLLQVLQDHASV